MQTLDIPSDPTGILYTVNQFTSLLDKATEHTEFGTLSKNIKELTVDEMRDPKKTVTTLAEKPTKNSYSYIPLAIDDTACDNATKACVKYTLSATLENSKSIFTRSNLN